MRKQKIYEDDDGRTVADMSGVSLPPTFLPRSPSSGEKKPEEPREEAPEAPPFTPRERRMYVFAALKASLLIAAAFIVGLGLAILLMLLVWT